MNIFFNGTCIEIGESKNIEEFLLEKGIELDRVVVEYNCSIAKRTEWNQIMLKQDDKLEVLKFVGGG